MFGNILGIQITKHRPSFEDWYIRKVSHLKKKRQAMCGIGELGNKYKFMHSTLGRVYIDFEVYEELECCDNFCFDFKFYFKRIKDNEKYNKYFKKEVILLNDIWDEYHQIPKQQVIK